MISIITNCYNGEKYLEETIQSVLSQTYTDWEYLLFDNNSTDRSAEIFLSHKDPRFKYFKNFQNYRNSKIIGKSCMIEHVLIKSKIFI